MMTKLLSSLKKIIFFIKTKYLLFLFLYVPKCAHFYFDSQQKTQISVTSFTLASIYGIVRVSLLCAHVCVRLSATCLQPLWDNWYAGRSSAPGSFRPLWSAPCKSTTWNYRSSVDFSSLEPLNNVCLWKF